MHKNHKFIWKRSSVKAKKPLDKYKTSMTVDF